VTETFCGLAENLEGVRGGGMSQWARGHTITWRVQSAPPGFTVRDLEDVVRQAFGLWEDVAGVHSLRITAGEPNILIRTGRIDGGRGILAQAQLPQSGQSGGQLWMELDESEAFIMASNPPSSKIDILRVVTHELGHNLGLGHAQAGSRNLMAPAISDIRAPQPGFDIPQALARYGDQVPDSGGPDTPEPPAGDLAGILRDLLAACDPQTLREAVELLRAANEAWRSTR